MSESAWDKIRRLTQERDDARRERDTLALGIIHPEVPELTDAEQALWDRPTWYAWPNAHPDHAVQYARLDLTFRADT